MSVEFSVEDNKVAAVDLNIENLLQSGGSITARQTGRRSRRRAMKKRVAQASLLAPILAAEGCLTFRPSNEPDMAAPEADSQAARTDGGNAGGGIVDIDGGGAIDNPSIDDGKGGAGNGGGNIVTAQPDAGYHGESGEMMMISAADLLANDGPGAASKLTLVRVFDAHHGHVMLHDGMVHFTPDEGFEGVAQFSYEVVDENGVKSQATVSINVTPDHGDGHGDHGNGDHGAGHGDGHDEGGHGGGGHAHPDDPSKQSEHMAVFNLVPVAEATHIAINDGSWFDPNTWAGGEVPGEGAKVLISEGISVDYDGESAVSLFTVRVDGSLDFATDANTFMEVDTLVVSPSGHMTIGTVDNPVAANVEAIIQIADNGPIDVAWDPMLLSRGVISHGGVEIHGAEKDSFLKVAADPMAGDTSLTLEEAPEGWQVGDVLVLTGTRLTGKNPVPEGAVRDVTTEDEELIITAINGNTITFNKPLEFDHDTPRADLKAYVANYSRNVRIETENADNVDVHERGHTMFMHSDDIDIRYAEFHELGRTDKSERAFDVADVANIASDSNVKARYSLHLHRTGVENLDDPAMVVGNSVWGSPGWGYVHHDSNAVFVDNAAYDVFGAAFVAETGNETGRWAHNISIKNIGVNHTAKNASDLDAFDLGRTGAGFWFQSRLVDAVDNVAASSPGGHGFVYNARGWAGDVIPVLPEGVAQSESLRYADEAFINIPNISQFVGNEAIGVDNGLEVIKANPAQGHDVRSVIDDFTAWETRLGVHLQYTAHYTLKDIDVLAAENPSDLWHVAAGIQFGPNVIDVTVNNARIEGFPTGVELFRHVVNLGVDQSEIDFDYNFIDVNIIGATNNYVGLDADDRILNGSDLVGGRLTFDSDLAEFSVANSRPGLTPLELSGTKVDSIGATDVSSNWDPHTFDWFSLRAAVEQEGYWTLPDGRVITSFDQYISDRATGDLIKVANLVDSPETVNLTPGKGFVRVDPEVHGELDLTNQAPVAGTDRATVNENGSITINVLANDSDPDGDPLAVDGLVNPTHGRLVLNDNDTITYIPDPNYHGADQFSYWVEDDAGHFAKANVLVTVAEV